ncbi:uncharacterized PE-PGRS family protein PE_PGRS3 isoform X1 [Rhipicephalus sanguineus]|uniref:uncharacterized PE-PGRS family protein PE_PGRS3 isoform X1 n=1 Tax=Rhipicephalus sanguineus TaxID=34632 RepID=UPI0020C1E87B|nr:uncharacterized PE-PGRS family protein PE_PGRS3 isoform X1 [Rhipicephalus sanguineus]
MARMFVPAALWLCATLLGQQHNVQGAPRPVRQISPGLLEEGSTQQKVTQQQSKTLTKPFSHAVDHGPYTATVHATPFMSSGVLGGIGSALGGLHSTVMDGLHGALHGGGMLGGVPGFHTPLTAASHLLSGTFGAVGHHLGGLTGASPLGGLATPLTSPLSALSPALSGLSGGILPGSPGGGMSVLTHTVHYGSSGDMGLAAAEHQHLTSTAHQHSLLASQALAAADAVENAQLQASLARRHLIHKALAHQSLASQAQMMAHNAHARLLQAQAAHTSVMSMYHNGFGQGYPMMGMPAYAGFPVGGYPGGMMPLVGGAMGYAENPLHSIIRKHCTTVRYINGGGGMYPMPLGLSSGIGGSYPYGVHSAMALGHGVGVYGMHGAYGSSPLLAGGVAPLHSGLGMGIAGLHGGYGGVYSGLGGLHSGLGYGAAGLYHGLHSGLGYGAAGLYNGLHSGLGYGAAGLHGGLGYGATSLYHGLHGGLGYGAAGLYHGLHGGLGYGAAGLYHGLHSGLGYGAAGLYHGLHGGLGYGASGLYHGLHGGMGYGAAGLYHGLHGGLGYGAAGLYHGLHSGLSYGAAGLHSGLGYGIGGLHGGLSHAAYGLHSGMGLAGGSLAYGAGGLFGAHHPVHTAMHSSSFSSYGGYGAYGAGGGLLRR